jgi:hypothetical protein
MDTFEKTFLESNREFKFNSKLDKFNRAESKKLFNKLLQNQFTYKISQREENFETFIANILYDSGTPISMCYDKNWYPGKSMAYTSAIAIKNTLKKEGYINIKDGYNFPDGRRHARIWATEKLVNEFKNVKPYCGGDFNLVELKSKKQRYDNGRLKRKKGKLLLLNKSRTIPFKENEFTIQLRRKLEKINRINKKFKMTLDGVKLDVAVKAVFTESFNYHGRVYANGSNRFQQYSGEDRSCILIDGEPVIERDYSGLHPRMLYAQEGIQFNEDPYMIVSGNPAVRPFLKTMLLTMVNSETFNEAQLACNAWLNPEYVQDGKGVIAIYKYQNDLMSETGKEDFEEKCKQAKAVKKTGIDTAKPLMEKFLKEHERIRKYLCSGNKTGMKLMNKDSKIALYVCKYFINKKIPVLPVHDSFIVQAKYKQELKTIMDKAYRKYTKGFDCPIK